MNNWEGNPKLQFDRRRLERCYKLDYKDIQYKEECLKTVEELKKTPVKTKTNPRKKMSYKNRPYKQPYWNFWRAVFAGWLIRYPIQILRGIGTVVIGLFLFGVLILNPGEEVSQPVDQSISNELY